MMDTWLKRVGWFVAVFALLGTGMVVQQAIDAQDPGLVVTVEQAPAVVVGGLIDPQVIELRGATATTGCVPGTSVRFTWTDDGRDSDGSSSTVVDPSCAGR